MAKLRINQKELRALGEQVATSVSEHLNETVAAVAATHSGQPIDVVHAELMRRATGKGYTPSDDAFQPAAEAISTGEPPPTFTA